MTRFNLEDVRKLGEEANTNGLKFNHHQISDLLKICDERIEYYNRLKVMMESFISKNRDLSISTMIGPFLRSVSNMMAEDAAKMSEEYQGG